MKFAYPIVAALSLFAATPLAAQNAPQDAEEPPVPVRIHAAPAPAPKLLVVISVDQFSADLFAEYRRYYTAGFARLLTGAVFPSAYQGHAATETCPGHSTILTGDRPAHTGIIANDWIDPAAPRADKTIYCAEDETVPGTDFHNYAVSDKHLRVPTLGEWMKLADPASRVVSVAGKDRAAVMMGGHKVDELWYWWEKARAFQSYPGRAMPPAVARMNALVTARLSAPQEPMALPDYCKSHEQTYPIGTATTGSGRFARPAGDTAKFKASPEFDETVMALAAGLATDMKLGQGASTDLLIVGASATDYIGHGNGNGGTEMCLQMFALDQSLGKLFAVLDSSGVDYAVLLTADHGATDIPERSRDRGAPDAARVDPKLNARTIGTAVQAELKLPVQPLSGGSFGDIYIDPTLTKAQRAAVQAAAIRRFEAHPQVYTVFTRARIAATPSPKGPPETWSLIERARASYDAQRSGDFIVVLKPRITPIAAPGPGYAATHGSVWDYDRRVPVLFWRKGMRGFEHPLSIETADIAPTLAALIHVPVPVAIDGRCIDLDAGPGDSCK